MRVLSPQYIDLVRAQRGGTLLSEAELQAEIPAVIQPVITVPAGVQRGIPSTTEIQRSSFLRSDNFSTVGVAAGGNNQLAVFGSGLWSISFDLYMSVSGGNMGTSEKEIYLLWTDPGGTQNYSFGFMNYHVDAAGTSWSGATRGEIMVLLPEDSYTLAWHQNGVAAGKTLTRIGGLICNKLA